MKSGFDLIQAQLDIVEANNDFSDDLSEANRKRAEKAEARCGRILKAQADAFAVDQVGTLVAIQRFARHFASPKAKRPRKGETEAEKQKLIEEAES